MNSLPHVKSLSDIRQVLDILPDLSSHALKQAEDREIHLTKPLGSLGRLETVAHWIAAAQNQYPPRMKSIHCNVYAGNHGVAAQGVSAYPQEVTAQMVQNFINGGAAVNQICEVANVDLQVHEMALEQPTGDISQTVAMSDEDCAEAFFYGMTTVKDHTDLLCIGEMGIANTTSAAAISYALYQDEDVAKWVGRGTGVDDEKLVHKAKIVKQAVETNALELVDPLCILQCLGGRELAAMAGAVIAARLKRIPVLLDGYVSCAAVAPLEAYRKGALDHCLVAHRSVEPGHSLLCAKLEKQPLLDLNMGLGEASGSVLAVSLIKSAVACHNNMATFSSAGVSVKEK